MASRGTAAIERVSALLHPKKFARCLNNSKWFAPLKPVRNVCEHSVRQQTQVSVSVTVHLAQLCTRQHSLDKTVWPSGLRRWLKAPVRKGVGSNPTAVICVRSEKDEKKRENINNTTKNSQRHTRLDQQNHGNEKRNMAKSTKS